MVNVHFKKGHKIAEEQTCLFYILIDLDKFNSNTVKFPNLMPTKSNQIKSNQIEPNRIKSKRIESTEQISNF